MTKLFRIIGILITAVYGIYCILPALLLLIFIPIMSITDGIKIINTGFSVTGFYLDILLLVIFVIYVSLRIRPLRRIYNVFPFLFETIKFLIITGLFLATGAEVLNWCYTKVNQTRHIAGITVFVGSIVLWRILISVYYYRKPLIDFLPKKEEGMKNYNSND